MSIDTILAEVRAECATMLPGATVEVLEGADFGAPCIYVNAGGAIGLTIYADGKVHVSAHGRPVESWRQALAEMRAYLFRMRRNIDHALWGQYRE